MNQKLITAQDTATVAYLLAGGHGEGDVLVRFCTVQADNGQPVTPFTWDAIADDDLAAGLTYDELGISEDDRGYTEVNPRMFSEKAAERGITLSPLNTAWTIVDELDGYYRGAWAFVTVDH